MADVVVFVDDAVRGTLPAVCVKDGVPTGDLLVVRDELGDRAGLGVAWLLLLAGPLGWIGLVILSVAHGGRSEVLTVQVPFGEPAYQRVRAARRLRRTAAMVGVLGGAAVLVTLLSPAAGSGDAGIGRAVTLIAVAAVAGAIVAALVADQRSRQATIGVDLDASRRWVTLSRVHPAFAEACEAQEQQQGSRA